MLCCRYGDLTPKGIGARLFTVVWILVGLVNFSILTGALTTALTTITVYDNTLIYGVQVSALLFSLCLESRHLLLLCSSYKYAKHVVTLTISISLAH